MTSTAVLASPPQRALLDDVVSTLVSVERTIHQLEATKAALLAVAYRIAEEDTGDLTDLVSREMAHRAVATEIGAALRVPDRTIEAQMGEADRLQRDFPATAAAFGQGRISRAHARMILDSGDSLGTAGRRAVFEEHVLERALVESVNRVRPYAKQIAERVRETTFAQRHSEARARRQAWVTDEDDGVSILHVRGSSVLVHGAFDRITRMGHAVTAEAARVGPAAARRQVEANGEGESSTFDRTTNPPGLVSASDQGSAFSEERDLRALGQVRADIACDLLLTGVPMGHDTADGALGAIHAQVEVSVPFLTLTEPPDAAPPGHLEGVGPVDPETARVLARNAPGWDRVLTDPVTGAMLIVDRYRPTEQMRRHLRSRDRRCRFPGCRVSARKTDADHSVDFTLGGATDVDNLAGKCRRHHVAKHHTPWTVRQRPGGVLEWTSPTGRTYADRPPGVPGHVTLDDVQDRLADCRSRPAGDEERAPF